MVVSRWGTSRRLDLVTQSLVHPETDRIVAPGQEPGIVGMQALHAPAGTSHSPGGSVAGVIGWQFRLPFHGVTKVGLGQSLRAALGLSPTNTPGRLETAHPDPEVVVDQPVKGGHRASVLQHRMVADHNWPPSSVTYSHREPASRFTAQALPDQFSIRLGGLPFHRGTTLGHVPPR